jgi:hypothetical protein
VEAWRRISWRRGEEMEVVEHDLGSPEGIPRTTF